MTDRPPLGKIRVTPLRTPSATPEPAEPGRHRRASDGDTHIPRPRTPVDSA